MIKDAWKNKAILRNAMMLVGFCLAVICAIALIINTYATRMIEDEYIQRNFNAAADLQNRTDEIFKQARGMAAYLATEPMVQTFFNSATPSAAYDNHYVRVQQLLEAYAKGIDYIHSVYLYSPVANKVISSNMSGQAINALQFSDNAWMGELNNQTEGFLYLTRCVENNYPFVVTVLLHRTLSGIECVVAVNINLQALYKAVVSEDLTDRAAYCIDENGHILLRRVKSALYEELSTVPQLLYFDASAGSMSRLEKAGQQSYVYSQVKSEVAGLYCVSVSETGEYAERLSKTSWLIVIGAAFVAVAGCVLAILFSLRAHKPVRSILSLLDSPDKWQEPNEQTDDELRYISERIVSNIQTNKRLRDELDTRLDLLNKTQIQTLQLQISPHFLYNTLNLIGMKVADDMGQDYAAVHMLDDLATLLRYSLESIDLVPLSEEREYTSHYLHLLWERYSGIFDTHMQIDDDVLDARIPRLLLQPLIENCVFHGVARIRPPKRGLIEITGQRVRHVYDKEAVESVRITVTDNGEGMDEATLLQLRDTVANADKNGTRHIGVQNVARRLWLLYQNNSRIDIQSAPGEGTKMTITFPMG